MKNNMWLTDFIFPRRCHICDEILGEGERYVCNACLARIPRTRYHRMPMNPMEQRFAGLVPFERATGVFFYSRESDIAILIQDFKYRGFRGLARYLGEVAGRELFSTGFLADADLILPVPMHFMKRARRGYNQTEQIAAGLSKATGIPVGRNLKARRPHRTQTALTLDQRRRNTAGLFGVNNPEALSGKCVVLLDDVCTTGATLTAAATALADIVPDIRIILLTLGATF